MKKIIYNKLVRDNIPEIIKNDNAIPQTRILNEAEYRDELVKKLLEETQELIKAKDNSDHLALEIGDIYEVLSAIVDSYELDRLTIMKIKEKIKEERGGFEKRIFLESVEEKD
jgi:predicted house-cleaning noncanonical NTP pyrophosphatase (MazG superfamily)